MTGCQVEGCTKRLVARGLCTTHYYRLMRNGHPTETMVAPPGASIRERLLRYSARQDNGCVVWTGATNKSGYGKFQRKGKTLGTHRVAWELVHGEIPDGLFVCHRCDNPPCVNVDHLFLGTARENVSDMVAKGRKARLLGESHPLHKLSESDASDIKTQLDSGLSYGAIAGRFGVSKSTVWRIANGLSWAHVVPEERKSV